MKVIDLSRNRRLPVLMELMHTMGSTGDGRQLLNTFLETMRRAYGRRAFLQIATNDLPAGAYRIQRLQTHRRHLEDPLAWPEDGPVHQGGLLAQVIEGGPKIWHDVDFLGDPVMGEVLAGFRSLAAAQVYAFGGPTWLVLLDPSPDAFEERDLEDLLMRGNLLSAMITNLENSRRLAEAHEQIHREIDSIARIQRSLLPEALPEIPGLRLAASYRTFDRAGGDFYDVARLGPGATQDDPYAILIGDVSGHGPAAAVVMAIVHTLLRSYPGTPSGPAELMTHVNRHLCAKRIEQSFVTAFLGFYEPATRRLTYCRAGHNPPLLKDFPHRGPPQRLDAVGELPLGIMPDVRYSQASTVLRPGQTLIVYTDGITDGKKDDGELFGIEGIEQSLIECTGEPDCAIGHINKALHAQQVDVRPDDDQTIIAIQVL
jgi:phosphoserine phosphatase RsbU/P